MKVGVVVFPGSNCDADAFHVVEQVVGKKAVQLWHKERSIQGCDVVIVPGGFSYGDYLRCGAIARFAPVMEEVAAHAARGGKVMGICNGFQILCEAALLPGTLMQNKSLKFLCTEVSLRVDGAPSPFTRGMKPGDTLRMPIAHAEGNYFLDDAGLDRLEGEGQVVFRYEANPNGAARDIAGIVSAGRNVLGMMPHPERATEALLGSTDGRKIFESLLS
jgi:phosphoribosylformylglycinamidine synthase subunit PurQ / glutaminase